MFSSIFTTSDSLAFGPQQVVINLLIIFILSLLIAWVYKYTHKGLSYSQGFVMTLILSGIVITAVMMIIGNNIARAFGAFGAFSLIRFRTAIKDTKDMGYIFLVLAVGMGIGTGNYIIALATTIIVLLILLILTRINFGSIRKFDYILTFDFDTQSKSQEIYKSLFDKYLKNSNILNIKSVDSGQILQLSFSIKFIDEKELNNFVADLKNLEGLSNVTLITAKNDIEY